MKTLGELSAAILERLGAKFVLDNIKTVNHILTGQNFACKGGGADGLGMGLGHSPVSYLDASRS